MSSRSIERFSWRESDGITIHILHFALFNLHSAKDALFIENCKMQIEKCKLDENHRCYQDRVQIDARGNSSARNDVDFVAARLLDYRQYHMRGAFFVAADRQLDGPLRGKPRKRRLVGPRNRDPHPVAGGDANRRRPHLE